MSDDPFAPLGLGPGATAAQVHAARRRLAKSLHPDVGGDPASMAAVNAAAEAALVRLAGPRPRRERSPEPGRSVEDRPSFTIEALPAEAFEALLVVTSWIGEVVDDDPPYTLETTLSAPLECWCRLELVPEAGSSSVSVRVAGSPGYPPPDVDAVRDLWIAGLNELDWDDLGRTVTGAPDHPPLSRDDPGSHDRARLGAGAGPRGP